MTSRRSTAAALAVLALAGVRGSAPATADVANLDAIAVVTDTALSRIAQALLPVRFVVDGTDVTLDGLALCPATDEHDFDLVGLGGPDGSPPMTLPAGACGASLATLADQAAGSLTSPASPAAATSAGATPASAVPWRAAMRVHVAWNDSMLKGTIADTAISTPAPHGAAQMNAVPPDAQRLRAVLTATPLFLLDTRHLIDLEFSGKRFQLAAVPKFEEHRVVVELMRDGREAEDRAAWLAFEGDAGAAVPPGSDAVVAATHPFLGRTLAEAFASPVEVYRTQDHVIALHDVRESGANGDVRASGEAVDTTSGLSGTITGEYTGSTDLTLRRVDVVAHERSCSYVDLGCVANNVGLRIGSGALARQLFSRYGNSPLRPAQPVAFPIALEGRNLNLTIEAIQTRSTAEALRIAGRLDISTR